MISDNLVTAHAHNVTILYGATVNINPVSAPAVEPKETGKSYCKKYSYQLGSTMGHWEHTVGRCI